jgi:hypothetical protein
MIMRIPFLFLCCGIGFICILNTLLAVSSSDSLSIKERRQLVESNVPTADFNKAKELLQEASNLIYHRYQFNRSDTYQFFLEVSNLPPYSWDIQKYKIAQKIVDGDKSKPYLMVFGGSSVTAGHDNYYYQSYPFVLERRLSPAFEALGVKLVVRNTAQGANNCRPFDYCYESMGGEHADFILWEQSFNCGRDRAIFEYMARVAYWSGAVLFYMASGGWMPSGCPPSKVQGLLVCRSVTSLLFQKFRPENCIMLSLIFLNVFCLVRFALSCCPMTDLAGPHLGDVEPGAVWNNRESPPCNGGECSRI